MSKFRCNMATVYLFDSEMTRPPAPLVWVCREGVNWDTITIFSSPSDKVNTQTLQALLKAPQWTCLNEPWSVKNLCLFEVQLNIYLSSWSEKITIFILRQTDQTSILWFRRTVGFLPTKLSHQYTEKLMPDYNSVLRPRHSKHLVLQLRNE